MNGQAGQIPTMVVKLEQVDKMIETVRATTYEIHNLLRLSDGNKLMAGEIPVPRPTPPLIQDRIESLEAFHQNLLHTHSLLEEILIAVREI